MDEFYQDAPRLGDQYADDVVLGSYLRWRLPHAMLAEIEPGLRRLGHGAAPDLIALGAAPRAEPPRQVPNDAWGRRVDDIVVSDSWRALDRAAAE